jgi:hypothetical protein
MCMQVALTCTYAFVCLSSFSLSLYTSHTHTRTHCLCVALMGHVYNMCVYVCVCVL